MAAAFAGGMAGSAVRDIAGARGADRVGGSLTIPLNSSAGSRGSGDSRCMHFGGANGEEGKGDACWTRADRCEYVRCDCSDGRGMDWDDGCERAEACACGGTCEWDAGESSRMG